jgi:hypothetical protein
VPYQQGWRLATPAVIVGITPNDTGFPA